MGSHFFSPELATQFGAERVKGEGVEEEFPFIGVTQVMPNKHDWDTPGRRPEASSWSLDNVAIRSPLMVSDRAVL